MYQPAITQATALYHKCAYHSTIPQMRTPRHCTTNAHTTALYHKCAYHAHANKFGYPASSYHGTLLTSSGTKRDV